MMSWTNTFAAGYSLPVCSLSTSSTHQGNKLLLGGLNPILHLELLLDIWLSFGLQLERSCLLMEEASVLH